jgi:folate-dependent phosphoribosylglycinamide formyltransferase PurN
MKRNLIWKAFFSQSGSEIHKISKRIGRFPDAIITNKSFEELDKINPDLLEKCFERFVFIPKKPTVEEYREAIRRADVITLHGYLRILPPEICGKYKIYNGHPGLITRYPELKGKDPQAKVWQTYPIKKYNVHGHVIHEVIPEVDAGRIVSEMRFGTKDLYLDFKSLDLYIEMLHRVATDNWAGFISKSLLNKHL